MSASVIAATQDIARCTITGKGYDEAHGHASEQFGHGLAYTAGVLASFAVLGGALLALRAGGQAIDWGFQLQTLVFVAVVAYLLFAMGLSLSGVVTFGAGLAGTDGRLAAWSGMTGTFFTGVVATIVTTPAPHPSWVRQQALRWWRPARSRAEQGTSPKFQWRPAGGFRFSSARWSP
jgi:hypothetical protein